MRFAKTAAMALMVGAALTASPAAAMPGPDAKIAGGAPLAIVDIRGGSRFRGRHRGGFGRGSFSRGLGRPGFHQRGFRKRGLHHSLGHDKFRHRGFRKGHRSGGFGHGGKSFGGHHGFRPYAK